MDVRGAGFETLFVNPRVPGRSAARGRFALFACKLEEQPRAERCGAPRAVPRPQRPVRWPGRLDRPCDSTFAGAASSSPRHASERSVTRRLAPDAHCRRRVRSFAARRRRGVTLWADSAREDESSLEWTVIGTGLTVLVANIALFAWLRGDVAKLSERVNAMEIELRERMAKLEGLLEDLRESIAGRRPA